MFGEKLVDCYVEKTPEYILLPDADGEVLMKLQKDMKEEAFDKF